MYEANIKWDKCIFQYIICLWFISFVASIDWLVFKLGVLLQAALWTPKIWYNFSISIWLDLGSISAKFTSLKLGREIVKAWRSIKVNQKFYNFEKKKLLWSILEKIKKILKLFDNFTSNFTQTLTMTAL